MKGDYKKKIAEELEDIPEEDLSNIDEAKILDKHYIPARYPNGFESGAPFYFYTKKEAQEAVRIAGHIIEYCKGHIG